jgi:esterase
MTYPELAGDLALLIDSEVKGPAHVLGHSMGGKVAMQLALNRPGSVQSLVVVDISPRAYPPRHDRILEALLRLDPASFHTRAEAEAALARSVPDLATRRFLLQNLAHRPEGGFRWRMGLREIHAAYADLAAPVSGPVPYHRPVLFLKGERSEYLAESDLPQIRRQFPRAELQIVPGAAHWVQVDNPHALLRLTLDFLRRHAEAGTGS